jgi:hypothetical protein
MVEYNRASVCARVLCSHAGGRSGAKPKRRRRYMLEEFQIALRASGATPVLMVNMLTSTIAYQLEFLHHARAIGALPPHSYVELGGEFRVRTETPDLSHNAWLHGVMRA